MNVVFYGKRLSDGKTVSSSCILTTQDEKGKEYLFIPQVNEPCEYTYDKEQQAITSLDGLLYAVDPDTVEMTGKRTKRLLRKSRRRYELRHRIV